MTTICLIVLSIAGQFCYQDADPIGECTEMGYHAHLCVVSEKELPLYLSAYDPALCASIPTNCNGNTDLGTGVPYHDWYGIAAACPIDWVSDTVFVDGVGEWTCMDTGGAIRPTWRGVRVLENGAWSTRWMWVIVIDVLYQFDADPALASSWPWWSLMAWESWGRR